MGAIGLSGSKGISLHYWDDFNTLLVQGIGNRNGPVSPAVAGSAAFGYESAEEAEAIFSGSSNKPLYARMGNPTTAQLESVLAQMEGGFGALATSSGMGAVAMLLMAVCEQGDRVLCVGGFFGGTYAMMKETMPRFGIRAEFCDVDDKETMTRVLETGVKLVLVESVGNPNLKLPDIEGLGTLCKEYRALLAVDNTVTPLSVRPLELGADFVLYSTTKLICGNASALGGALVFPKVTNEGVWWHEKFSALHPLLQKGVMGWKMVFKKRALRDFGMSPNAFASYLTLLGLETLALRMERIAATVPELAAKLCEAGFAVRHPSLDSHEHHARYLSAYPQGCGPVITLELGNKEAAFAGLDRCRLALQTANIGDSRTLALHMQSTIYRDFDEESRNFLGVTPGLVRLSVGLESVDAILKDFLKAFKRDSSF